MSLSRLRTFIEVYRQRSITAAAKSLNLTQPAVSQHIAGLEAALASARARSLGVAGTLQIIGHADFMAEKLPHGLLPLLEAEVRIRMHTGDGPLVIQMLLDGHCDLGISAHPVTDERLKSEVIFTDSVLAVAAPAVVERILRADNPGKALNQEPLLAYNLELSLIDNWLSKNQIPAPDKLPALRSLLSQGFGWTVLPEYLCSEQLRRGELVVIPPPVSNTEISYNLIWAPGTLRQPRVAHARDVLLAEIGPQA